MENHKTTFRRGRPEIHRDRAIVERFNRTLAERLFGHQYAVEMLHQEKRSTAWVKRLPDVVDAFNGELTSLIRKNQLSQSKKRLPPPNLKSIPDLLARKKKSSSHSSM